MEASKGSKSIPLAENDGHFYVWIMYRFEKWEPTTLVAVYITEQLALDAMAKEVPNGTTVRRGFAEHGDWVRDNISDDGYTGVIVERQVVIGLP